MCTDTPVNITAGFPEMWQPVYNKYRTFFEAASKLQPIVSEMMHRPVEGELRKAVGRMAAIAANTYGAVLTLVLNGYGHDAMRLGRSLLEAELNILWLIKNPKDIDDYLGFHYIRSKQYFDMLTEEDRNQAPKKLVKEMNEKYDAILPRFVSKRDRTRPRSEWCRESLFARAKAAGPCYQRLYKTLYGHSSSLLHGDIGGLEAHTDREGYTDLAPSWALLEDALMASGCALRCVCHYDELAQLGFKDRLESGPLSDYAAAFPDYSAPRGADKD